MVYLVLLYDAGFCTKNLEKGASPQGSIHHQMVSESIGIGVI